LQLVPPARPITIQDLLRHTAGFTYGIFGKKNAVRKIYLESGIEQFPYPGTNRDFVAAIAKLPLLYQPGEKWGYSHATHVLGRLLEVIDGKPLGEVLRNRILAPLGMDDTDFWVPPEKHDRIAEGKSAIDGALSSWLEVRKPMTFESAGGGLVSTVPDYARFCQMMLNGGVLDGKRIISPRTVELMTANHLDTTIDKGDLFFPGPGQGFGLGFQVRLGQGISPTAGSPGQYSWGGIGGTVFWIDPRQKLILIYMMQDMQNRALLRGMFQTMSYAAMEN
jgi:CubicO group peptidase (beta-lactamase class C family)